MNKRSTFTIALCSFVLLTFSVLSAEPKVLIDFNKYETKLAQEKGQRYKMTNNRVEIDQNGEPVMEDYAIYPSDDPSRQQNRANLQPDPQTGIPQYNITVADMLIRKWIVQLNSSANTIESRRYSMCRRVKTLGKYTPARNVLGARVHFPAGPFNAWAKIMPPFELVAFSDTGRLVNVGNGVVDNTGQIYDITIEVNGRNYNNSITIRLKDENDEMTDYFMGYLFYAGWKKLVWKNPNYVENVDLREIFRLPLYPKSKPYKKLDSFIVFRHGDQVGGDFVVYISEVRVSYDLAILEDEEDIDDERVWKIISDRQKAKALVEKRRNAEIIELRRIEQRRQNLSEAVQRMRADDQLDVQQAQRNAAAGDGGTQQPGQTQPGQTTPQPQPGQTTPQPQPGPQPAPGTN